MVSKSGSDNGSLSAVTEHGPTLPKTPLAIQMDVQKFEGLLLCLILLENYLAKRDTNILLVLVTTPMEHVELFCIDPIEEQKRLKAKEVLLQSK